MRSQRTIPQIDDGVFIADGGLETTLVFHEGLDLPCFAAFPLLVDEAGRERLARYFEPFLRTAEERDVGFIFDTPTWRANTDWGAKLGYSQAALDGVNRQAVAWATAMRDARDADPSRVLINGAIGPRGDGYRADARMSAIEAQAYHAPQIRAFGEAGADMVTAYTMNYADEAVGVAKAAQGQDVPVVISFTVETDGKLASGESLREAIEIVDQETDAAPAYYMVNCAHPSHFDFVLAQGGAWIDRIRGVRANASAKSHAELDESTTLDAGDPADLGRRYRDMRGRMKGLSVFGGCCGTDHRHIAAICDACLPA